MSAVADRRLVLRTQFGRNRRAAAFGRRRRPEGRTLRQRASHVDPLSGHATTRDSLLRTSARSSGHNGSAVAASMLSL
jgi:hypothetical protein